MPDPAALAGDIDLTRFLLNGTKLRADITEMVTGGEVESTIEGASTLTLTVHDPDRRLFAADVFAAQSRMVAVDRAWEFVKVDKSGDDFTLTFEDEIVAALRRQRKAAKAVRGTVTRAQFIRSRVLVVKRPRIIFVSPELPTSRSGQQITLPHEAPGGKTITEDDRPFANLAGAKEAADATLRWTHSGRASVFGDDPSLHVNDSGNPGVNNTFTKIPTTVPGIAVYNFRTAGPAEGKDGGWWVLRAPNGRVFGIQQIDVGPSPSEGRFVDLTPKAAQAYGYPYGMNSFPTDRGTWRGLYVGRGAAAKARAGELAGGLVGDGGGSTSPSTERAASGRYEFTQGPPGGPKNENAWDMSGRLAEEVGRRRFVVGERFYYVSEATLFKSRAMMILSEDLPGVDVIDYSVDVGAKVDTATVTCHSKLWQTPPGSVVLLNGMGKQVDGRWLVSSVNRGLFSDETTVELRRARALLAEKREPPAEQTPRTTGTDSRVPSNLPTGIRAKIAEIANSQVGVHEGSHNSNPYGPDAAWCAYFASWVWRKAGVNWETTGWAGSNPPSPFKQGQHHGSPQVGDAVNYSGHVGIVTSLTGGDPFVSVEGNYSNAVTRRKSHSGVVGFKSPPGA